MTNRYWQLRDQWELQGWLTTNVYECDCGRLTFTLRNQDQQELIVQGESRDELADHFTAQLEAK